MKKKVCMIVQDKRVKGGIASVISGYYDSVLENDFDIIYVESYRDGGKLKKLFKALRGYLHFFLIVLFWRPDIVHIHSSFGPSFYRKLPFVYFSSWVKIPIINHIHGADFDKFYINATNKKQEFIKKTYNKCSLLIALSPEWKDNLSKIVDDSKIQVIENYSIVHENEEYNRLGRKCNNMVLFLGEIGERKGGYDIPLIVSKVKERFPDVIFNIAGEGNVETVKEIKDICNETNVADNIIFSGWVRGNDKEDLLRSADVFLLPSYNEGMPMAILDAMGYGLPIVSTNVGGIPLIVHNEKNGYCCTPGDINGIADCIISLLSNDELRKEYGHESICVIKEGYTLEKHIESLERCYRKVLE